MRASTFSNFTVVHLELTSKCQAGCPQCPRNLSGDVPNPILPLDELSLEDIQLIFPLSDIQNLRTIYVCGNFGEPTLAKDFLKILRYFRESNQYLNLIVHTNGSTHSPKWWIDAGKIIGPFGRIVFGIDGLEDTHHLYRRHTNWKKIIFNALAAISTKVEVNWDMIIFEHNQHQIDPCRALAKELGFSLFVSKKTHRFSANPKYVDQQPVLDKNSKVLYFIKPSTIDGLANKQSKQIASFSNKHLFEYLDSTCIKCKALNENSVSVDFTGKIYPCNWMAVRRFTDGNFDHTLLTFGEKADQILDGRKGISNVVNHEYFTILQKSWALNLANGKPAICARVCGELDEYSETLNA